MDKGAHFQECDFQTRTRRDNRGGAGSAAALDVQLCSVIRYRRGIKVGADNEGRDMGCVRENFQNGLDAVIGWYRGALQSNAALQEAFIRKFDDLCE